MKILEFLDEFLTTLLKETAGIVKGLILFTFGATAVYLVFNNGGLSGKIMVIAIGVILVGSSAVLAYCKLKNKQLDKQLAEAKATHQHLTELHKLYRLKKGLGTAELFKNFIDKAEENYDGKK